MTAQNKTIKDVIQELKTDGVSQMDGLIPEELISSLRKEVLIAVEREIERHGTTEFNDLGRLLFAPVYGGAFLRLLDEERLIDIARIFMSTEPILYTMTSSCIPPNRTNYTHHIHIDTLVKPPGAIPLLAMQILLDDFTEDNGSPKFLKGSQLEKDRPSESLFESQAEKILGKKGAVNFFDPWVWHRSTENKTDDWRCCILMGFVQPWMKQRFNIESMLAHTDLSQCSERARGLLGFHNLPPGSWEEFYKKGRSSYK